MYTYSHQGGIHEGVHKFFSQKAKKVTTEPIVIEPPLITIFIVNHNTYPFYEDIPDYATEIIFEENSYPDESYCDLSIFPNLVKVTFMNGAFANADTLHISNPYLVETNIGDGCFNGLYDATEEPTSDIPFSEEPTDDTLPSEEPTSDIPSEESSLEPESEIPDGRRLKHHEDRYKEKKEKDRLWRKKHPRGMHIHDGRKLKKVKIGKGSMKTTKNIRIIHATVDIKFEVNEGSLNSVEEIAVPTEESVAVNLVSIATQILSVIINANTKTVKISPVTANIISTEQTVAHMAVASPSLI